MEGCRLAQVTVGLQRIAELTLGSPFQVGDRIEKSVVARSIGSRGLIDPVADRNKNAAPDLSSVAELEMYDQGVIQLYRILIDRGQRDLRFIAGVAFAAAENDQGGNSDYDNGYQERTRLHDADLIPTNLAFFI